MELNTKLVGHDLSSERDLYVLAIESASELPRKFAIQSARFVCLLAWDARDVSDEEIAALARKLLQAGAVYVSTWGSDCERVHDIIDTFDVLLHPEPIDDRVIMTTWHDTDSLQEALWFVLNCTWPAGIYSEGCDATVAISIANAGWASEILDAFSDPSSISASGDSEAHLP
ncbi:MAG: hypothetical protein QM696_00275 [Steroidobacteraceae bacterium]